jgi:hypothetical protein
MTTRVKRPARTEAPVEPDEPGWYGFEGGDQGMILLLTRRYLGVDHDGTPAWWAIFDNGGMSGVNWEFIAMTAAGRRIAPLRPAPE